LLLRVLNKYVARCCLIKIQCQQEFFNLVLVLTKIFISLIELRNQFKFQLIFKFSGLTVGYAAHCQQESALDRPIAGHANLCPESISTKPQELQTLLSTVKHEILHALGDLLFLQDPILSFTQL
jgi:hypothetical protein